MKYESSEGSMMIDLATIHSLELIQNLQNPKSKDCLFGLLNQTLTPMGARKLKSTILQPSTDQDVLEKRHAALTELSTKEDVFFAVRQALKSFVDTDRVLTAISIIPTKPTVQYSQQSINNVIMLKQYVKSVQPVYEALANVRSDLLNAIAEKCAPNQTADIQLLIDETINEDITYQKQPLDLRNQRTYAVKSGVNGLLDVARQTYKESNADAYQLVTDLGTEHNMALDLKYDSARQYYIRIPTSELADRDLPPIFINVFRKKNNVECQTLDLLKWNQKIIDSHHEVVQMSDQSIQKLIDAIREDIAPLFKISEAIALLDMMASFAQTVTTQNYTRPDLTPTLAIKSGRHPIHEKIHGDKYVPNDVYATPQSRFQIITGCNMSGKSSYIRSIALMTIMAQLGSFVPAQFASFPIRHQLFARVSTDDSIEANVSTFAAEMRETAFILRNIDMRSMVIVDELGRGTSTRDGLCIAIAVAEALIDSSALVWFATHFHDLPRVLAERSGVVNLHLQVEMGPHHHPDPAAPSSPITSTTVHSNTTAMKFSYLITPGPLPTPHYGLHLAKSLALFPPQVIRTAEMVSARLSSSSSSNAAGAGTMRQQQQRRRGLVLKLREQLVQAREGRIRGEDLREWLIGIRGGFVGGMCAVDGDGADAEGEEGEEEGEDVETNDGGGDNGTGGDGDSSEGWCIRDDSAAPATTIPPVDGLERYLMSGAQQVMG